MKTTDLMIGDFLRNKRTKEIIGVFEIDGYRYVINNEADGYNSERNVGIEEVEPIPLTAEILEKNGFERQFEARYSHPSSICSITIDCEVTCFFLEILGKDITCDVRMGLQYVHELQHALRLCGLHKLADNFKI